MPLTYSALASGSPDPSAGGARAAFEMSEQYVPGPEGSARETVGSSLLKRNASRARLASLFLLSACLAALAVTGIGAAGASWRKAMQGRGMARSKGGAFAQDFITIGKCETPKGGSQCARDISYAMDHVKKHPDWYVGLHEDDDPKAFQWFLHKQIAAGGKPRCPPPCHWDVVDASKDDSIPLDGKCHTSVDGEACYNHVTYTMKENLPKHPEWYPGLPMKASFKIVQNYLHKQGVCPKPCHMAEELKEMKKLKKEEAKAAEDDMEEMGGMPCHTAEAGEACYGDVLFAMGKLKGGMHDEWYSGKLNKHSTFEEVQAYLSKQNSENQEELCPQPCNKEAVENITKQGTMSCNTAQEGDKCWKAVVWVVTKGIVDKPEWYKGDNISTASTFEHVQNRLAAEKGDKKDCESPACPCETAKEGDGCWTAIQWVMKVGLKNHSSWYDDLPKNPTFEQVQTRLHNDKHTKCKLPCIFAPWWDKPEDKPEKRLLVDGDSAISA